MLELENKYIDLLLKRCLNLTKSTSLFISYDKTCDDFVKKLVLRAKELGYSDIYEDCSDIFYLKNKLMNSSLDEIENDPYYDKSIWDKYAEKKANFLMLETEFPGVMDGVDSKKLGLAKSVNRKTGTLVLYKVLVLWKVFSSLHTSLVIRINLVHYAHHK